MNLLGRNAMVVLIAAALLLTGWGSVATAQQTVSSVDLVFIVDESGSMAGEQSFLANQATTIDQALTDTGITNNRFGLVGFTDDTDTRLINVGMNLFGTAAEFGTAAGNLVTTNSGTEDGYLGIKTVLDNYTFRPDVAKALVLVTDENRDEVDQTLDFNTILNSLQTEGLSLTSIMDQTIFAADGTTEALVLRSDGTVAIADGAGGITKEQNGSLGPGDGTQDYADLSLALNSCVADLNQLREGGLIADSFTLAFLECLALTIEQQVEGGCLAQAALTPRQKAVLAALLTQQGAENDLGALVEAIRTICAEQPAMVRKSLNQASGAGLFMQAGRAMNAVNVQGFNIDSRIDAIRRGGTAIAMTSGNRLQLSGTFPSETAAYANQDPHQPRMMGRSRSKGRAGYFLYGAYSTGDYEETSNQSGGDYDTFGGTFGLDYHIEDNLVLGVAFGATNDDTDFDDGSSLETNTDTVSIYGTYFILPDLWLDGMVSYGFADFETERLVTAPGMMTVADGETDGGVLTTKWRLVQEQRVGNLYFGPEIEMKYINVNVEGYQETGAGGLNLDVDHQDARSFTTSVGGNVSLDCMIGDYSCVPYANAAWVHEYQDDARRISSSFTGAPGTVFSTPTDGADDNYFDVGAGVTVLVRENLNVYADYSTILSNERLDNHTFRLGMRMTF